MYKRQATGNKLAGTMSSLYPEQQKVSREFDASKVLMNGKTIDWNTITNDRKVNANEEWVLNLVKSKPDAKEADSLVSISIVPHTDAIKYDSLKTKRIIPVSYTHLDVYKRQEKRCIFKIFLQRNGQN